MINCCDITYETMTYCHECFRLLHKKHIYPDWYDEMTYYVFEIRHHVRMERYMEKWYDKM